MAFEAVQGPKFHSYNLTVETKLNIDELIYMLNPRDLPLTTGLGSDGQSLTPTLPVDNRQFYWMIEEVPLPRAVLNTTINSAVTSVILNAGQGVRFAPGDVVLIESEVMAISAITTDTLTVSRGASGTSAAAHTAGAEVLGLGTVLQEGEIGQGNFRGRDKLDNYTQIFSKKIEVTRTEQKIPKYGVPNELNKQILNNTLNLQVGIEQALVYGVKYEDSATQKRQTGGLNYYVTSNVDSTSAAFLVSDIEDRQQVAWDAGGMFEILMSKPINFQGLTNLTGEQRIQTVSIDDPRRGRQRATIVFTEFGEVQLVRNRWLKASDAFGYTRENFIRRIFDPLTLTKLAKTKDTDSYMMLTELGVQVKGQEHMCKWTALNAATALPVDGLV